MAGITSRPLGATSGAGRRSKESAIISQAQLRRQRGAIERWTALVVLFASFVGTVVAFNGGWPNILALKISIAATLLGVILQVLLTYLEWHYYDVPAISWGARVIDMVTIAAGYGPLVLTPLANYLEGKNAPQPFYIAWLIIGLVSLGIAWYPESRLVE